MTATAVGETTGLTDKAAGKWVVTTHSSRYLLDLDERTAVREPGQGTRDDDYFKVNRWGGDEDPMSVERVVACEVGSPLVLTVSGWGWLKSTPIRSIEPVL